MEFNLILSVLGIAASGIALYQFAQNLRKARLIEDIPTSNIRSATQGYTELEGKACYDGNPVYSPASGEACVWYYAKVENHRDGWVKVSQKQSSQSFGLKDGTGICYIYPGNHRLAAANKRQWFSASMYPAEFKRQAFSEATPYRITEYIIKEHDFIYALGDFKTQRGQSPKLVAKQEMTAVLREWKQDYPALLARFDENKDQQIDQSEWEKAREQAYKEALKQAKANHNADGEHVLLPPDYSMPFIVANEDPKNLAKIYRKRMFFSIGGLVICLLFLFKVST